jgi:hypothetical protein
MSRPQVEKTEAFVALLEEAIATTMRGEERDHVKAAADALTNEERLSLAMLFEAEIAPALLTLLATTAVMKPGYESVARIVDKSFTPQQLTAVGVLVDCARPHRVHRDGTVRMRAVASVLADAYRVRFEVAGCPRTFGYDCPLMLLKASTTGTILASMVGGLGNGMRVGIASEVRSAPELAGDSLFAANRRTQIKMWVRDWTATHIEKEILRVRSGNRDKIRWDDPEADGAIVGING